MSIDLAAIAKQRKIQYFFISYVDLFGGLRAKLVPARAIGEMQENGAGFAGFATWLDMTPADPDMFAIPDPDSLMQLPWKPEIAWLAADLWMDGKPVEMAPRVALKRQIEKGEAQGFSMKTGVECEFFLLEPNAEAISDGRDMQEKPCYDQSALMRRYDVISEICNGMIELGWNPYQNDHEDGNGQFEMNWEYDDCLVTADRHVFFKFMAKSIAENHGFRATFMPKPFPHLTGNGCHSHVSVWNKTGKKNLFDDAKGELGLSGLAYNFMGGVLHSADALAAIFNPTVNSYKRINAATTISGATWSPNTISYTGNNRTHMIRIPEPGRFELRLADGSTNPYLLQAAILMAGLDGIDNQRDPGTRLDVNMYDASTRVRPVRTLPLNLLDAIRLFDKSKIVHNGLGDELVSAYVNLKLNEWQSYASTISQWERDRTLDI
jgi:glutamine synthetase type III